MRSLPNPVSAVLLVIGLALARLGLVAERRARRTVELAWPRIVTGFARMSKGAADTAMVGVALGPAAIAGVGFAGPYWGLAFSIGGGVSAGTLALVSQRFGAERFDLLGQAIRSSLAVVVAFSVPMGALFYLYPAELVSLLSGDEAVVSYGADYLRLLGLGVPFAAVNLVMSRALIGTDDARIPMVLRSSGAVANVAMNAVFIFVLDMGVVGAALGTVAAAFAVGLLRGRLPGIGAFPVSVSLAGRYVDVETMRDVLSIGVPVIGRNSVWMVARFPLLAFVGLFGPTVAAAYIITRRIWALMTTPGWGFGTAASSLVGQELGRNDEETAEHYGREIVRLSVATYLAAAVLVAVTAEPLVALFVGSSSNPAVPVAVLMVYAAAVAAVPQGITTAVAGALDATGDTRWPFYSRALGMFAVAIPCMYLGATTALGLWGVYLSFLGETLVPATINYYRFGTGKWKVISRSYRPDSGASEH